MEDNILTRLFWVFFMGTWLFVTCTLVVPIIWYVITGKDWVNPEKVYNKINKHG